MLMDESLTRIIQKQTIPLHIQNGERSSVTLKTEVGIFIEKLEHVK